MCRTPDLAPPPCEHCGHCRHCGQPYGEEGAGASEAPEHIHGREAGDSSEGGASAAIEQASKTASQECRRPHKKPPWMSPNRIPLISPGSGVYADPDEDGKWMFLNNAPYGRHSRPSSDVFGGVGWSYGYGCALGPFFGTGVGVSFFPTAPIFGAGAGCGFVCGVGASAGATLGIGKAFIALGFNEPLTQTPRFYELESAIEKFMVRTLHKYWDWRERVDADIASPPSKAFKMPDFSKIHLVDGHVEGVRSAFNGMGTFCREESRKTMEWCEVQTSRALLTLPRIAVPFRLPSRWGAQGAPSQGGDGVWAGREGVEGKGGGEHRREMHY
ncbi:hypothetical protein T484DRAFT_1951591, partial [Baffinella frigidus]